MIVEPYQAAGAGAVGLILAGLLGQDVRVSDARSVVELLERATRHAAVEDCRLHVACAGGAHGRGGRLPPSGGEPASDAGWHGSMPDPAGDPHLSLGRARQSVPDHL